MVTGVLGARGVSVAKTATREGSTVSASVCTNPPMVPLERSLAKVQRPTTSSATSTNHATVSI